jgi:hypothetical protein
MVQTYVVPAPIKGSMMRIVKVDVCGALVTGAGSSLTVVNKSFVQVQMDPQYEDGQEYFERTADGSVCVNQKDAPTMKRLQLSVDLCAIDPVAAAYVASMRLLDDTAAPVTGTGWAMPEGSPTNRFSLEVWQQVAGSGACDPSGAQRYIYNVWPNIGNTQVQTYTIENGRSTLSIQCETQAANANFARGWGATKWLPNNATGGALTIVDHWGWNVTTTPPPTAAVGPTTLT